MSNTVSKTVTDQELNAIMWQESKGDPLASPSTSSALGLFQFLKATWRDTVRAYRPDVFKAYSNGALLALRKNPSFSIEMGARFTEANRKAIGNGATLGDLYLAHFLGVGTARRFYSAAGNVSAVSIAGQAAARANKSVFYDKNGNPKTVAQVRAWSQSVMDAAGRKGGDYVAKFYKGPFHIDSAAPVAETTERPGIKEKSDHRLYDNQQQLKSMNYNPGALDGVWGGGTAGALAAFFNDYAPDAHAPLKWQDYDRDYDAIDSVIDKAEMEKFIRPVTKERDEADPHTVEKIAPEIVPAKQGLWASITAFFGAVGTGIYQAFSWLLGWKDQIGEWGITDYLGQVPKFVWIFAAAAFLGLVIYFIFKSVKGIEKPVTTGERM